MCGTVVDSLLRILCGHEAVDEAGSEGIAAAHAVEDLKSVVLSGLIDGSVCPADGLPVIDGCGLYGAERRCDCLEVRILLCGGVDHALVAVDVELLEALVLSLDLKAKACGEVFLVADHDIDILCDLLVDLLALLKAADGRPHGRTIVEIIGDDGAVLLRGLDGLDDGLAALLGKSSVDAAGVQPADSEGSEDVVEIKVLGRCLGDGGVCTIGAADGTADTKATLCKVQAVAADSADAVCLHPLDEGGINAALLDEVLHELADFVVCKRGDDGGLHAEALVQAADDVVLSAALPCAEGSRRADSSLTGIQTQHNLAQRHSVKLAFFLRT